VRVLLHLTLSIVGNVTAGVLVNCSCASRGSDLVPKDITAHSLLRINIAILSVDAEGINFLLLTMLVLKVIAAVYLHFSITSFIYQGKITAAKNIKELKKSGLADVQTSLYSSISVWRAVG
jgi:hypothetical protein